MKALFVISALIGAALVFLAACGGPQDGCESTSQALNDMPKCDETTIGLQWYIGKRVCDCTGKHWECGAIK